MWETSPINRQDMPQSPSPSQKSVVPKKFRNLGGYGCLISVGFVGLIVLVIVPPLFIGGVVLTGSNEAKYILDSLNNAQQAFHINRQSFASNIEDLDTSWVQKYFKYEIITQDGGVIATATPIKDKSLKSYTGFIFVVGSTPDTLEYIKGICQTDRPSSVPPLAPSAPQSMSDSVKCPPGSTRVDLIPKPLPSPMPKQ